MYFKYVHLHISRSVANKEITNVERILYTQVRFLIIELILSVNRVTDMMLPCGTPIF